MDNTTREIVKKMHEAHMALLDAQITALKNHQLGLYLELVEMCKPVSEMKNELTDILNTERVGA